MIFGNVTAVRPRDVTTPEEAEAIAAWLAERQPTICPPKTFSDQVEGRDFIEGHKRTKAASITRAQAAARSRKRILVMASEGKAPAVIAGALGIEIAEVRRCIRAVGSGA